ncbi:unnamed protein product [Psylliodes chrysocephalus]|uniref:Endonuclease-reverse transcriptase n=1 Tax=Psylliodes chrysocephalus TaxID=3402493 RepID=A0A9P0CN65_9CUCU|nr:unnamed protein product [Psylliodes chrysocephala]
MLTSETNNISKEISTGDIYLLLQTINDNITRKIEEVQQEVKTIKEVIHQEVESVKQNVISLKKENTELKNKLKLSERKLKINNLIIYGLPEEEEENQYFLINAILNLTNNTLKVSLHTGEINNIYRIGKKNSNSRPVLLSLISYLKKKEILNNCTNLRGTSIKIVKDLIEEDRKEKRILLENLKIARNGNKKTYIKGLKLFIGEVPYTARELINLEPEFNFSPRPQRKAASEPSTPSPKETEETEDPVYEGKRITQETNSETETKKGEKNEIKESKPTREFRLRSDGATIHSKSTKTASDLIKKPIKNKVQLLK